MAVEALSSEGSGARWPKLKFFSKIFIWAWILMFDPSKRPSWQTTLIFEVKKSLKNNFWFLKNSHNPLKIGAVPCPHKKKILKKNVPNHPFANFRAFWGLFNARLNVIAKKYEGGLVESTLPPGISRVKASKLQSYKYEAWSLKLGKLGKQYAARKKSYHIPTSPWTVPHMAYEYLS